MLMRKNLDPIIYGLGSRKRPLPISSHVGLTFWAVACRRFNYILSNWGDMKAGTLNNHIKHLLHFPKLSIVDGYNNIIVTVYVLFFVFMLAIHSSLIHSYQSCDLLPFSLFLFLLRGFPSDWFNLYMLNAP